MEDYSGIDYFGPWRLDSGLLGRWVCLGGGLVGFLLYFVGQWWLFWEMGRHVRSIVLGTEGGELIDAG